MLVSEHFTTLNAEVARMNFGRMSLPVDLVRSPEERYRARETDPEALAKLRHSLTSTNSVHDSSVFVLFVKTADDIPAQRGFNFRAWLRGQDRSQLDGFFAIVGDHTQKVMKELHADFPANPLWSSIPGQLLITTRSESHYETLKSWGIADNRKGEQRAHTTFKSKIFSLHADYVTILARVEANSLSAKDSRDQIKALKLRRGSEYGLNANSIGQLWGLAQRTGKVWDALAAILSGKVTTSSPKARFLVPHSAACFTSMGSIPDEDLVVLLNKVVDGKQTLKEFAESCKRYKATARVQREILEHEAIDRTDWASAQADFPTACDPNFVSRWVEVILARKIKQKNQLPNDFGRSLAAKVAFDLRRGESAAALQAVSVVLCFIVVFFFH